MQNDRDAGRLSRPWGALAQAYASSPLVAADQLVEWPAQLKTCGAFSGKRILDVGCGTGDKARYFADHGAAYVVGVDPTQGFASNWEKHTSCANLTLALGGFEDLPGLPALASQHFDLIVSFQSIMYARSLTEALRTLRGLLAPGGDLVFSAPHPFRFAILRNELEGCGHGHAYQRTGMYKYHSPWKDDVFLEHAMPRVSDYANAIVASGLRIDAVEEPVVTDDLRKIAPDKAEWMDRYIGILIFRAHLDA
jgi:SAM-dependent methyltransferase